MTDHATAALEYANRGWRVLPLRPRTKEPAITRGWQHHATTDANTIQQWWDDNPAYNIGILPDNDLVVIDCDPRDGGDQLLAKLITQHADEWPDTLTVNSGGADGGRHYYFTGRIKRACNLGKGLEIRGAGRRYVVAPPSIHPATGNPYTWADSELDPAPIPTWILDEIEKHEEAVDVHLKGEIPSIVIVKDRSVIDLLELPGGQDPSSRDYALAAASCQAGHSDIEIAALIIKRRETHGDPKHKSARIDYIERTIGAARSSVGIPDEPFEDAYRVYTIQEMLELPPPSYLIDKIIVAGGFNVLYGPADVGKTFAAIGWACSIATGLAWHDHTATQGRVVYITPEGTRGIARRFVSWSQMTGVDPSPNVRVITQQISLMDGMQVAKLRTTLDGLVDENSLVVIDTLARHISGGDESNTADMGVFVTSVDAIRETFGCAVLINHHTGHDDSRERGSSALRPASDAFLHLKKTGVGPQLIWDRLKDDELPKSEQYHLAPYGDSVALMPGAKTRATNSSDFRPTNLMEKVSLFLEGIDDRTATRTQIKTEVMGKAEHIVRAIETLIYETYAKGTHGAGGSLLVTLEKPFREFY